MNTLKKSTSASENATLHLCYVFSRVLEKEEDSQGDREKRLQSLVAASKNFKERNAGDLPTTTASLAFGAIESADSDYKFLLRFRYKTLEEVAATVIDGRKFLKNSLTHTLTLIEFGRWNPETDRLSSTATPKTLTDFGILLVQIDAAKVTPEVRAEIVRGCGAPDATCAEVLGPFDYVVEFPIKDTGDAQKRKDSLPKNIKDKCLRIIPIECKLSGC
jgi:hypothetical protein